jgi:4-hydroxy-2-oxoglutarate aldolase
MTKLSGIFASLPTPFDWEGNVYPIKVQHNVVHWNRVALAGYVVAGRAGEANELTRNEKENLFSLVKQTAAEGRMLIAGVGSESLRNSIALSEKAAELGYVAVLAEPVGRDATTTYYRALADRSKLPVIVAGADLETAAAASQHPNACAVVASSDVAALTAEVRAGVQVLAGSAATFADGLREGASAAILAYAAAAPYSAITIWEAIRSRETEAAADWQQRINGAVDLVEHQFGIAGLKHALDLNGYFGGPPRLPLAPLGQDAKAAIEKAFEGLRG